MVNIDCFRADLEKTVKDGTLSGFLRLIRHFGRTLMCLMEFLSTLLQLYLAVDDHSCSSDSPFLHHK